MPRRRTVGLAVVLASLVLAEPAAGQQIPPGLEPRIPVTGQAGPGLEHLDAAMLRILQRHAIPGGALAVARNGKLLLARGYGWANLQTGEAVQPQSSFSIASLSKSLTAVTILKLVDEGKLGLDDPAFRWLADLRPPPGVWVDPRVDRITVRHLLNHSAGWDRARSGDPASVRLPLTADQVIHSVLTRPLDFDPGTQAQYSNFGYVVLGQVIVRVTGQPYETAVQRRTLAPMGVRRARCLDWERYYQRDEVRRYVQRTGQVLPPQDRPLPLADAAGGWCASAVDLARFLTAVDGSRGKGFLSDGVLQAMVSLPPPLEPFEDGTYVGLGWDAIRKTRGGTGYRKDGLLPGVRTFMGRLPNGICWVVLFNSAEGITTAELAAEFNPKRDIESCVHGGREWPDVDLFTQYQ
jgi:N-acyl-D-amino-acid deacylase